MGFFLVKSPLALAIGQAIIAAGSVVEMPDDEQAAHLVSNGTLELAEIDPSQAEAFAQAKADAGINPDEVMVASPDEITEAPVAAEPEPEATAPVAATPKPQGKAGKGAKA